MAGILPNEGENLVANMVFKGTSVDRGASLQLGLFTNTSISETTTAADLTEPTGGAYARKTLVDANWVVTGDTASYALQTFTATGSGFTGSIYGYFVVTTGTTPRIIAIEVDPLGPHTFAINDSYDVTVNVTCS